MHFDRNWAKNISSTELQCCWLMNRPMADNGKWCCPITIIEGILFVLFRSLILKRIVFYSGDIWFDLKIIYIRVCTVVQHRIITPRGAKPCRLYNWNLCRPYLALDIACAHIYVSLFMEDSMTLFKPKNKNNLLTVQIFLNLQKITPLSTQRKSW